MGGVGSKRGLKDLQRVGGCGRCFFVCGQVAAGGHEQAHVHGDGPLGWVRVGELGARGAGRGWRRSCWDRVRVSVRSARGEWCRRGAGRGWCRRGRRR